MVKIYKTTAGKYYTLISVNGINKRIVFEPSRDDYKTGFYTTADKEMQQAVESSSEYGKKIFLFKTIGETPQQEKEQTKLKKKVFKTWQEASLYLTTEYGAEKLKTPTSIQTEGAKHGLEIVIEK